MHFRRADRGQPDIAAAGMLTAIQRDATGDIRYPTGKIDTSAVIVGLKTPRRGGGEAATKQQPRDSVFRQSFIPLPY